MAQVFKGIQQVKYATFNATADKTGYLWFVSREDGKYGDIYFGSRHYGTFNEDNEAKLAELVKKVETLDGKIESIEKLLDGLFSYRYEKLAEAPTGVTVTDKTELPETVSADDPDYIKVGETYYQKVLVPLKERIEAIEKNQVARIEFGDYVHEVDGEEKTEKNYIQLLTKGGAFISGFDASEFVKDGFLSSAAMVEVTAETVTEGETEVTKYYVVGTDPHEYVSVTEAGKYLRLVWNTDAKVEETLINLKDLVNEKPALTAENYTEAKTKASNDNLGQIIYVANSEDAYNEKTDVEVGKTVVTGLYTKNGDGTYTEVTEADKTADAGVTYYSKIEYTAGPYVVTGAGEIAKLGTTSATGDLAGDVEALKGRVATVETKVTSLETLTIKKNADTGEFYLAKDGEKVKDSESISFKDYMVRSGSVVKGTFDADGKFAEATDGEDTALKLVLNVKNAADEDASETIYINAASLVDVYDVADDSKDYLVINGYKIGVKNLITKINGKTQTDGEVTLTGEDVTLGKDITTGEDKYTLKEVTVGNSVKGLYTLADGVYTACAEDAIAEDGTAYYEKTSTSTIEAKSTDNVTSTLSKIFSNIKELNEKAAKVEGGTGITVTEKTGDASTKIVSAKLEGATDDTVAAGHIEIKANDNGELYGMMYYINGED